MMRHILFSVKVIPLKESDKSAVSKKTQTSMAFVVLPRLGYSRLESVTQLLVTTNFFTPFS